MWVPIAPNSTENPLFVLAGRDSPDDLGDRKDDKDIQEVKFKNAGGEEQVVAEQGDGAEGFGNERHLEEFKSLALHMRKIAGAIEALLTKV